MEVDITIYKLDSKGKSRLLRIYTDNGTLYQESGLIDGKLTSRSSVRKPKNVGRSNATTAIEQARLEATSKIISKLKEGYFETLKEAQNTIVLLPMLAKDYKTESHKINYDRDFVIAQPKLDGMRLFANKKDGITNLISRTGRKVITLDHIIEAFNNPDIPDGIYDGEAYNLELGSFQEQMKAIKTYTKGVTEQIKFNLYDVVSSECYASRYGRISHVVRHINSGIIQVIRSIRITSPDGLNKFNNENIEAGYEGTIIRLDGVGYELNKRSSSLLKYKDFLDETFTIINVVPSDKNPKQGVVHCTSENGAFACGMKLSHKDREEMLTNKTDYIGKTAEVRFFEYTDDELPRFPVFVGVRLDK